MAVWLVLPAALGGEGVNGSWGEVRSIGGHQVVGQHDDRLGTVVEAVPNSQPS